MQKTATKFQVFTTNTFSTVCVLLTLYYVLQVSAPALQAHLDEAHFLLSGHVNSKNNVFWGSTPPEHCLQRPLHSVKCTAWVAISKHGIIGPLWFEDDDEKSVTINTERYVQVLLKFWTTLGRQRGVVRALQWFQQDGATPHTSNESL